jgi:hypothetical protein
MARKKAILPASSQRNCFSLKAENKAEIDAG